MPQEEIMATWFKELGVDPKTLFAVLYAIAQNNYCKNGMSPGGVSFRPDDLEEVADFVADGYTFEDAFSRVIKELDEINARANGEVV